MIQPTTKKAKLNKCCKNGDNLCFNYGDAVEFEVYTCKKCDSDLLVNIEIVRDFDNMELV